MTAVSMAYTKTTLPMEEITSIGRTSTIPDKDIPDGID